MTPPNGSADMSGMNDTVSSAPCQRNRLTPARWPKLVSTFLANVGALGIVCVTRLPLRSMSAPSAGVSPLGSGLGAKSEHALSAIANANADATSRGAEHKRAQHPPTPKRG